MHTKYINTETIEDKMKYKGAQAIVRRKVTKKEYKEKKLSRNKAVQ